MKISVLTFAVSALLAQQGSDPTIRLNVRQVLVPIVVTDQQGRHVYGLRAGDFQVFEDGIQQQITAFTEEGNGVPATRISLTNSQPTEVEIPKSATSAAAHTFVICVDTLHTSVESFERARQALEKLFQKESGASAQYVLLSLGRQLQMVQTATSDVTVMRSKLKSKAFTGTMSGMEPQRFSSEITEVRLIMENYCGSCACGRDASTVGSCRAKQEQIRTDLDARASRWALFGGAFFTGLKSVVEELGKLDGARTLILVSDGFAVKPGKEFYSVVSAYLPNSTQFAMDPAEDMQPTLDQAIRVATERNVVVDGIDARSVYSPSFHGGLSDATAAAMGSSSASNRGGSVYHDLDSKWSSIAWENGSALEQIARATGGAYFRGSNDLTQGFRNALSDGRDYYTIAYVPANAEKNGKFRRISVKAEGKPVNIRAKAGYWAEQQ